MRPILFLLPLLFDVPGAVIDARASASAAVPAIRTPIETPDHRYASPAERNVIRAASEVATDGEGEENGQCKALRASMADAMVLRDQGDVALPGIRARPQPPGPPGLYGKRAQLETRYRALGCR